MSEEQIEMYIHCRSLTLYSYRFVKCTIQYAMLCVPACVKSMNSVKLCQTVLKN